MAFSPENFEVYAGNSIALRCHAVTPDGVTVPLVGVSVLWRMARTQRSTAIVSKASSAAGQIIIANDASGQFDVVLLPSDTSGKAGLFYHEATLIDSQGHRYTGVNGYITIKRALTPISAT